MANSTANVVSGKPLATGGVLLGALGTEVPEDASTTPDAALKAGGYIGEDGVTMSNERSTEKVRAWGGDTVAVLQTEHTLTFSFTFIEGLNSEVLKAVYGASNVSTTAATSAAGTLQAVTIDGSVLPHQAFVFEIKDGDKRVRVCVPDGQITEVGETTFNDGEVVAYQVTVEAFPGGFEDNVKAKAKMYSDDGKKTAE